MAREAGSVTSAGRTSTLRSVTDRSDRDPGIPVVADDDDWFRDPFQEPDEPSSEVAWEDDDEPPPPAGPPGLGERQAVVVLAVVAIVVVIAVAILIVRAFGDDSGSGTTATTPTTPAATTTSTTTTSTTTTATDTGPTTTTPTSTTPSVSPVPTDAVLKAGSTGASVEALQLALTELGYEPGAADGKFGAATTQAVSAFQAAEGLKEDGIAGPETLAAVNTALANG